MTGDPLDIGKGHRHRGTLLFTKKLSEIGIFTHDPQSAARTLTTFVGALNIRSLRSKALFSLPGNATLSCYRCKQIYKNCYFQIGLPEPGSPSRGHFSLTVRMMSSSMRMGVPHSRLTSGGHLLVASNPIFEPNPDSGEAKSR